jgi:hypothetical protein
MPFNNWRAEAARIADGLYGIDLDRVPKPYLWHLFVDHIPSGEAAMLGRNVIAAQPQHNATDIRAGKRRYRSGRHFNTP